MTNTARCSNHCNLHQSPPLTQSLQLAWGPTTHPTNLALTQVALFAPFAYAVRLWGWCVTCEVKVWGEALGGYITTFWDSHLPNDDVILQRHCHWKRVVTTSHWKQLTSTMTLKPAHFSNRTANKDWSQLHPCPLSRSASTKSWLRELRLLSFSNLHKVTLALQTHTADRNFLRTCSAIVPDSIICQCTS